MTAAYFEDHPTDPDKVILRKPSMKVEGPFHVVCQCDWCKTQSEKHPDGIALTNIHHPNGASATDDLNADALEVVELELPDEDQAVGWADGGVINWIAGKQFKHASYLYTTPPQRKPLTENEIKHLWYEACQTNLELTSQLIVHLARNIEAAHGIKGLV